MTAASAFDDKASSRLDTIYGTPDVAAQRARILEFLQPLPGERIADLGCGPGYLAADLARAVAPGGLVHGLDSAPDMVAIARRRTTGQATCQIEAGDVCRLPFADASLDAVVSIQVLEHIDPVERAISEMFRVLRPAGRAAVMATDWAGLVCETEDHARLGRVIELWAERGAHPHLPSRLGPLLRAGGFRLQEIVPVPMLNTRYDLDTYAHGIFDFIHRFARKHGDPAEAEAFIAEQRQLGETDRFFFCLNRFLFLAEKP